MSNDTRLWVARLVFWGGMLVNGWAFSGLMSAIMHGFGPNAKPANTTIWVIIVVLTTVALIPAGVLMHRYKKQRWAPSRDPADQARSEVEILAAYAALEKQQAPGPVSPAVSGAPSVPVPPAAPDTPAAPAPAPTAQPAAAPVLSEGLQPQARPQSDQAAARPAVPSQETDKNVL